MLSLYAPIMLWGLAGLSLPVVAHLLRRGVAERFDFPAVWLLEQSSKDAAAGARLWHYLLLFLRTLAIALLVFAFARPQTTNPEALNVRGAATEQSESQSNLTLILLDASGSMRQKVGDAGSGEASCWDEAIVAAQRVLDQLQAGKDRCQIWRLDGSITPLLPAPTANLKTAHAALLVQSSLTGEPGDFPGGLRGAGAGAVDWGQVVGRGLDMLEASGGGGGRLVVITDRALAVEVASKKPIDVRTVSLVQRSADNLAMVSVRAVDEQSIAGAPGVVRVGLRWFGESQHAPKKATIELLIDGASAAVARGDVFTNGSEASIDLPVIWPGAINTKSGTKSGYRRLEARLLSVDGLAAPVNDAIAADNQRRAGVYVHGPVQVTVVPANDATTPADAWVAALALSPHQDGRDRLRARVSQVDAPPTSNDANNVVMRIGGQGLPEAWRDWIQAGGRLISWASPRKEALGDSRIATTQPDSPLVAGFTTQAVASMADGLNAVGAGRTGALLKSGDRFNDALSADVWLRDSAGQPLVVHEVMGDRGRRVRFALSFEAVSRTGWFVPLLQQAVAELAPDSGRLMEVPVNQALRLTGIDPSMNQGSTEQTQTELFNTVGVVGPDGQVLSARSGRTASGVWYAGLVPVQEGLYQLLRGDHVLAAAVATASVEESDLTDQHEPLTIQWASRGLEGQASARIRASTSVTLDGLGEPAVFEWWPLCLAAAGLVMLVELLLSGKAVAG